MPFCPECGNEISDAALACPNCGRPIRSAPVVEEVVVQRPPAKDTDIPKWAYIPVAVIGGLALLLLAIVFLRNNEGSEPTNVNLKVTTNRSSSQTREVAVNVPPANTGGATSNSAESSNLQTTAPATPPDTRGTVAMAARVVDKNGQTRPVRNERFYLLDKEVARILAEAEVEPIEGNSLMGSIGLAMLYPERYGEFNRRAMAALRPHIKQSATSDGSGRVEFSGLEPEQYYLFAYTRGDDGFAVWSSPVVIRPGMNTIDLPPQTLTDLAGG